MRVPVYVERGGTRSLAPFLAIAGSQSKAYIEIGALSPIW